MNPTPIIVGKSDSGQTLAALVKARFGVSWNDARKAIGDGRVLLNGRTCRDGVRRIRAGESIVLAERRETSQPERSARKPRSNRSPTQNPLPPGLLVRYLDDSVMVVDKPAGLTTMRHATEAAEFGDHARRFLPKTLADYLPRLLPAGTVARAVHRIDRDTSGLVVFALNAAAESDLGQQFRAHTVERRYLAIVRGRPTVERIESWLVRDRGDGRRGSGPVGEGQRAVTHVKVLEDLGSCSLVECRLETGRTHQVRIHLAEAGAPLAGETVYDRPLHGKPVPDPSGSPRIALHAASLGFAVPPSSARMSWESPLPADLQAVLDRLRRERNRP